ncbi:uncharacterized protein LOC121774555 [Salvia splendens]|uniref:uncharacterized protein LOC121774555 n=1 Tax=Salvia splendens TaxID=180675 RepID=UPI001C2514E1|nr:uncharacterized protein LOC121774555 [Salvia splendens]
MSVFTPHHPASHCRKTKKSNIQPITHLYLFLTPKTHPISATKTHTVTPHTVKKHTPKIPISDGKKSATSIHISALDGIVNVNSLFTLAVFIGLAWNPTDPSNSIPGSSYRYAHVKQPRRPGAHRHNGEHRHFWDFYLARVNKPALRVGYVVSAAGSVTGSVFLMLTLVNVVQIKLGVLGCGGRHAYAAVVPLVTFVPAGLLIYVCFVFVKVSVESIYYF